MLGEIRRIARRLAELGWLLRSGGADGADEAFESGCDDGGGRKLIFLPWPGFHEREGIVMGEDPQAALIASEHHPQWKTLKVSERKLHARNSAVVLGEALDAPSAMLIGWTPNARGEGGTGQAYRVARAFGVPVIDLARPGALQEIAAIVRQSVAR